MPESAKCARSTPCIKARGLSGRAFLRYSVDDSTWAVVFHSHGNRLGELVGGLGETISPSDVNVVSRNLQFAALWGCDLQHAGQQWRRRLGLDARCPSDSARRLAAHPTGVLAEDYDLGAVSIKPPPIEFINSSGGAKIDFVDGRGRRITSHYTFPQWIAKLPQG